MAHDNARELRVVRTEGGKTVFVWNVGSGRLLRRLGHDESAQEYLDTKVSRSAMSAVALGRGALHGCARMRAGSWCVVDAAFSLAVALLQLLVASVLNTCFLLYNSGGMLQHKPHAPMMLASDIGACARRELVRRGAHGRAQLTHSTGWLSCATSMVACTFIHNQH